MGTKSLAYSYKFELTNFEVNVPTERKKKPPRIWYINFFSSTPQQVVAFETVFFRPHRHPFKLFWFWPRSVEKVRRSLHEKKPFESVALCSRQHFFADFLKGAIKWAQNIPSPVRDELKTDGWQFYKKTKKNNAENIISWWLVLSQLFALCSSTQFQL